MQYRGVGIIRGIVRRAWAISLVVSHLLLAPAVGDAAVLPPTVPTASSSTQVVRQHPSAGQARLGPVGVPGPSPAPGRAPALFTAQVGAPGSTEPATVPAAPPQAPPPASPVAPTSMAAPPTTTVASREHPASGPTPLPATNPPARPPAAGVASPSPAPLPNSSPAQPSLRDGSPTGQPPTPNADATPVPSPPAPAASASPPPVTSPAPSPALVAAPPIFAPSSGAAAPSTTPTAAEPSPTPPVSDRVVADAAVGVNEAAGSSLGACGRAFLYWAQLEAAARATGADPDTLAALLAVEGSGERSVSAAGALGLMQLLPDKFRPGDDPFAVSTNLLRAAQHVAELQRRYGSPEQVAAAYFGAIDGAGRVTGASDGHVDGFAYVRRFGVARACVQAGLGRSGPGVADLASPLGAAITPAHISFGFLGEYGAALATYIRGAHGVQRYGTRHLAWDLVVPGAPANGRGFPVFAPLDGRIVRTSDPAGGPFGIWLENPELDLRARLMHMDGLAPGIADGARVRAGQWLGALGGQGTEEFPHLHLSLERLSTGERLDPARFFFRPGAKPVPPAAAPEPPARPPISSAVASLGDRSVPFRVDGLGDVRSPKVWANTIVWEAMGPVGRIVEAYDLELGLEFRVGGATGEQLAPAIAGDVVVWLDTRHAAEGRMDAGGDATGPDGLVDIYAFDLATGRERRLSTAPGRYDAPAVGPGAVAWVRRDGLGSAIELYDLRSDALRVVDRSRGRPGALTISDRVLAWVDRPSEPGEDGELRGYDLATGRLFSARRGPTGRPVAVGAGVYWEEAVGAGQARLVRGLDVERGEERTITSEPRARRGLAGSGGALLWEEPTDDGRAEVRMYGLASGEAAVLHERAADGGGRAEMGHGTVIRPTERGQLLVTYLPDWDLADGRFYAERVGERRSLDRLGYSLTNEGGIPFWDEYRRLGGAAALGRPVSGRITLADGLAYQATERAVLRWRPDLGRAVLADALEVLEQQGHGDWLHDRRQIPRTIPDAGRQSRQGRLTWLTDPTIRERFLANPDPTQAGPWTLDDAVERYGLPVSKPEDFGPFVAQRFEHAVFQRWKTAATEPTEDDHVTLVHIGAIFREVIDGATQADE